MPNFLDDLEPNKVLLYMSNVVKKLEVDAIRSLSTREDRVLRFVDTLQMAGPNAFSCFLKALDVEKPFLAVLVRKEEGT
jgi:hypothetical protein